MIWTFLEEKWSIKDKGSYSRRRFLFCSATFGDWTIIEPTLPLKFILKKKKKFKALIFSQASNLQNIESHYLDFVIK